MKLNSKIYDVLKWICIVFIPALTTLASVVLKVWNLATPETITAIVTTATAVDTFLGALIGVSSINYNKENKNE